MSTRKEISKQIKKLPQVGEKYKNKYNGEIYRIKEIDWSGLIILRSKEKKYSNLESFWLNYEEI